MAWLDISSGRFSALELQDTGQLAGELERLQPAELLVPESMAFAALGIEPPVVPTGRPDWLFDIDTGRKQLEEKFATHDLSGFGCEELSVALGAAGCLLEYCQDKHRHDLPHITSLRHERSDDYIRLDSTTRRNLEIADASCRQSGDIAVISFGHHRHLHGWTTC